MGNASSKAARKLQRGTPSGHQVGSRIPATTQKPACIRDGKPALDEARAKTLEDIEKDAKDRHLTEKLNRLGPVRVDHHMQTVRVNTHCNLRMQPDAEGSGLENRLLASSLTELLEARKSTTNSAELETLASRYHIDASKLEQIGRIVSTPSTDERTVVRTTEKHGEESRTMMAHWIDPVHPQ